MFLVAASVSGAFAAGVFFGATIEHFALPPMAPPAQTGAVGITTEQAASENPDAEVLGAVTEREDRRPADSPVQPVPPKTDQGERIAELNALINDRGIAIARIIEEIERVRASSLETVTAFEQNCNNWQDACALPYRATLEQNDTRYEELAAELDFVRRSREQALVERDTL